MKGLKYIFILICSVAIGQTRYVTTSGGGNGTSTGSPWTLSQAFSNATAGMTIYVKAGNYGSGNYSISTDGTSGSPIKFIGYKTTPGDITATNGSTFVYGSSSYSTADYPTLVGTRSGGNVSGIAITINGDYVEIHNFQIKDKTAGINSYGSNNKLNNVIITDMGNHTGYSGTGVIMNGAYSQLTNSFIKNGVQLFTNTKGDYQLVDNNWFGCDQSASNDYSTDYYLLITGSGGNGANYNTISNNTVYRKPGQYHQGHGLIIKGTGMYNDIVDNTLINCPLEFSFNEVAYNTVTGGTITGTGLTGDGGNVEYAFILLGNGAHHNVFDGITITGDAGVRFSDWNDGWTPSPDTDSENAGHDNTFKNIIFKNLITAIEFSWHWGGTGSADNNIFDNCTFDGSIRDLFRTERNNSGTIFRNCVFSNNSGNYNDNTTNNFRVSPTGNKTLNASYINCHFYNNSWANPSGTNITSGNPLYTNRAVGDFSVQSGSPLINAGTSSTSATTDFLGNTRGTPPDIGAFEFDGIGGGGDVTPPTVTTISITEITTTSVRVTWYLNEGSTGRLEYGTTASYGSFTALETNYLTGHSQVISGLSPSTTYHYNIIGEDASGNDIAEVDRTFTTLADPDPDPEAPLWQNGIKSRFLKLNKF